jgi:spermidine/putrescine transport system substrate-binding protein
VTQIKLEENLVDRQIKRDAANSRPGKLAAICLTLIVVLGCGIAGQTAAPGQSAAPTGTSPGTTSAPSQPPPSIAGATPTPAATGTAAATETPAATATPVVTEGPPETPRPTPAGQVVFGNWPLYIDIDEDTGGYPTLEAFTEQTGIAVSYQEDINDNTEFFGKIQPDLAAGHSTGYDVIAPSDWMIARLIRLGYLQPLDKTLLPNFEANAQDLFRDPWYDPGNVYSIPWQAGIVGIGYNPTLTGRDITSFNDLLDPEFQGEVGMFSEMIDTMSLTLLSLGVKPEDATMADVQAAHDKLLTAAQSGQFANFYGNDYYDELSQGNIALTMAWSGDISQMQLYDNPDIKFVVPDTGGLLFVDNMVIPNGAEHPADAYALMDYWYTLEAAAPLTEYIGYFSPVKGVREQVIADAAAARAEGDTEWADQLDQIARDSFPDQEQLDNVFNYKILSEEEERQWNDLFNEVVNG